MVSTAGHLAHWAIFLGRFAGEDKPDRRRRQSLFSNERSSASPINPTARLALAQLEPAQNTIGRFDSKPRPQSRCGQPGMDRSPAAGSRQEGRRLEALRPRTFGRVPGRVVTVSRTAVQSKIPAFAATCCPAKSKCATSSSTWFLRTPGRLSEWSRCAPRDPDCFDRHRSAFAREGSERSRNGSRPSARRTRRLPRLRASRPDCTGRQGRGLRSSVTLERGRSALSAGNRFDR